MPDTRPRNSEGQFSPESGGGSGPGAFQAAYNPAVIMQNNEQRQAIVAAVNKRKQPQMVERTQPTGPSDTILSAIAYRLKELARGDFYIKHATEWAKKQKPDVQSVSKQAFKFPGVKQILRRDPEGLASALGIPVGDAHHLVQSSRATQARQFRHEKAGGLYNATGLNMQGVLRHQAGPALAEQTKDIDFADELKSMRKRIQKKDFSFMGRLTELSSQCTELATGKRFTKVVRNAETGRTKTVRYGQAGKASDGGDRIRPGTSKGDAYCARSAKIKGDWKNDPNSPNSLSRKKWRCKGSTSMK